MSYGKLYSVDRVSVTLRGNEVASNTWSFAPDKKKKYLSCIPCAIDSISSQGMSSIQKSTVSASLSTNTHRAQLSIIGEGTSGVLLFDQSELDFQTVLLNTTESRKLTLINTTDCSLIFKLSGLVRSKEGDVVEVSSPRPEEDKLPLLHFSEDSKEIPARSKYVIEVCI